MVIVFPSDNRRLKRLISNLSSTASSRCPEPVHLTSPQVENTIDASDVIDTLIKKHGQLYISGNNWQALEINKPGLKLGLCQSHVFVSLNSSCNSFTAPSNMEAISHASTVPVNGGSKIEFFFHGSNTNSMLCHVAAQFNACLQRTTTDICFVAIHFPDDLDINRVKKVFCNDLGPEYFKTDRVIVYSVPLPRKLYNQPSKL